MKNTSKQAGIVLPTNADMLKALQPMNPVNILDPHVRSPHKEVFNKIVAVIRINDKIEHKHLLLDYVVEYDRSSRKIARVDNLVGRHRNHNLKYPVKQGKEYIDDSQLVPIIPQYDWEFGNIILDTRD